MLSSGRASFPTANQPQRFLCQTLEEHSTWPAPPLTNGERMPPLEFGWRSARGWLFVALRF